MTQSQVNISWWQPTWKRLIATSTGLFLGITVFLAGRMQFGFDPALQNHKSAAVKKIQAIQPVAARSVDTSDDRELDGWERGDESEETDSDTQSQSVTPTTATPSNSAPPTTQQSQVNVDPNPPVTHSS